MKFFLGDFAWLQNLLKRFSLKNTSEKLLLHFQLRFDCKMQPFKCNIILNRYYYKNFIYVSNSNSFISVARPKPDCFNKMKFI